MNKYGYKELREAAESNTDEAINALGEWFLNFGDSYWNGEYYDADGMRLYPVYTVDEDDIGTITGWEVR